MELPTVNTLVLLEWYQIPCTKNIPNYTVGDISTPAQSPPGVPSCAQELIWSCPAVLTAEKEGDSVGLWSLRLYPHACDFPAC